MAYESRREQINNHLKSINAYMEGDSRTGKYVITGYTPEHEIKIQLHLSYKVQKEILWNIKKIITDFTELADKMDRATTPESEEKRKNKHNHWLHNNKGAKCDLPSVQVSASDRPELKPPETIADKINFAKILKLHPHAKIVKVIEDVEDITVFYRDSGGESAMLVYKRQEWVNINVKEEIYKLFPVNQKFHNLAWNLHHNHGQRAKHYLYNLKWSIPLAELEEHIYNIEQRSERVQDFTAESYLVDKNVGTVQNVMSALQAIRDSFKYLMIADSHGTQT